MAFKKIRSDLFAASIASPVGNVTIIFTGDDRCVGTTSIPPTKLAHVGERTLPGRLAPIASFLVDFPDAPRLDIDSDLFDTGGITPFRLGVYRELTNVAPGEVVTYGELAKRAGSPGASRAVGSAMANNPFYLVVPCHRVVSSTGLGGFSSGLDNKRKILAREGNTAYAGMR